MKLTDIKLGSRFRKCYGDLESLKESISRLGILQPIVLLPDKTLIAGARRLKAALELGISDVPTVTVETLDSAILKIQAEHDENVCREPFLPTEAVAIAAALEPLVRKEAEARQRAQGAIVGRGRPKKACADSAQANPSARKTRAQVAKAAGWSHDTLKKIREVMAAAKADPSLKPVVQKMDEDKNVNAALKKVRRHTKAKELDRIAAKIPARPEGKFDVIVIDPPWPMQKIERDCRPNQTSQLDYPAMSIDEIKEFMAVNSNEPFFSEFAAKDCHVFCWTTNRFLPETFAVLEAWGVRYSLAFVWHKGGGFQPTGLPQFNAEFCLYGRIGKPEFFDTKDFPTCFVAERGKHSEKPVEFYDMIRRVTRGRRLDVFNRREIEGFIGYGKEAK